MLEEIAMTRRFLKFTTGLLVLASTQAFAGEQSWEVTVTNLTKGQLFTPLLLVTHSSDIRLFTAGEPALAELATIAESGSTAALEALLAGIPDLVYTTVKAGGPLFGGETMTLEITGTGHFDRLSFAGMLVPTNDTFVGLNSLELPKSSTTVMVPAYDAGSELNDELCDNIPGPQCGDMDNSGATGEGYVYIGNGIRGTGDLDSGAYDWNNPVARVEVRRVK
jgi:hypothetical protein